MSSPRKVKLVAIIFLTLGTIISFAQCKEINVSATVAKQLNDAGANQSILVKIEGQNPKSLEISFFGPAKTKILRTDKTEFNNLVQGKYLIVVVGKREDDNYCPKSINITID